MMYRYYRQYYRVSRWKLSLREYLRFVPGMTGFARWLIKYPEKSIPRIVAAPSYFQDLKADQKDFSDRCIEALRPKFEEFHNLGFHSPCFQKIKDHLDPSTLDHGTFYFFIQEISGTPRANPWPPAKGGGRLAVMQANAIDSEIW